MQRIGLEESWNIALDQIEKKNYQLQESFALLVQYSVKVFLKSAETFITPCFSVENALKKSKKMERVMGIGPTWPAWKAGALPLSYTRSRNEARSPEETRVIL